MAGTIGPWWLRLPADRRRLRLRAVRDGLVLAGLMTTAFILVVIPLVGRSFGFDAISYWFHDLPGRYTVAGWGIYQLGAFRYAPPIGLLFSAFGALPWWVFVTLWTALLVGCLIWLGGRWTLMLVALPPVALELYHGNIHLLIAVALALGFRYPAAWSFVLLTKVTPGVGLLWFAVRREWRALAIALGATAAISAISYLVAPGLWSDWYGSLASGLANPAELSIPPPLWIRFPAAILLVVWGARTDRPWTVAIAATLALPNLWPHGLVVALGAVPFLRKGITRVPRATPSAVPMSGSQHAIVGRDWRRVTSLRGFIAAAAAAITIGLGVAVLAGSVLQPVLTSASSAILAGAGNAYPP